MTLQYIKVTQTLCEIYMQGHKDVHVLKAITVCWHTFIGKSKHDKHSIKTEDGDFLMWDIN